MKVGDYVRLNNCVYNVVVINRIAEIYEDTILTENDGSMYQGEYAKEEIIKSSPSIIDLIEVGDYVNGSKVKEINNSSENPIYHFVIVDNASMTYSTIYKHEICSIVTHEQFESMEYKL